MTYSSKSGFVILVTHKTQSKVTTCNLKDCEPDVQSQQSMWVNVVIGNNRKFEWYKSFLHKSHSNVITMGFPNVGKVWEMFQGGNFE